MSHAITIAKNVASVWFLKEMKYIYTPARSSAWILSIKKSFPLSIVIVSNLWNKLLNLRSHLYLSLRWYTYGWETVSTVLSFKFAHLYDELYYEVSRESGGKKSNQLKYSDLFECTHKGAFLVARLNFR